MIDKDKIEHIAKLARLKINSEEAVELAQQLSKALEYFEQIQDVDVKNVEPLVTPSDNVSYLREDVVERENTAEELLQNAPDRVGNLFKVPPVV